MPLAAAGGPNATVGQGFSKAVSEMAAEPSMAGSTGRTLAANRSVSLA
jgi:hypothetical protein